MKGIIKYNFNDFKVFEDVDWNNIYKFINSVMLFKFMVFFVVGLLRFFLFFVDVVKFVWYVMIFFWIWGFGSYRDCILLKW